MGETASTAIFQNSAYFVLNEQEVAADKRVGCAAIVYLLIRRRRVVDKTLGALNDDHSVKVLRNDLTVRLRLVLTKDDKS